MQLQICSAVSVAKVMVAKGCVQSPSPKLGYLTGPHPLYTQACVSYHLIGGLLIQTIYY